MKHFERMIKKEDIWDMERGEYFTYLNDGGYYRKGLKVTSSMMIPVGLPCKTIAMARKQQ